MAISKKIKKIANEITGKRNVTLLKGKDLTKFSKAPPGKAYLFHYPNPVTKKSLPYFMETPLIVILSRKGNKILGVNLQHLTYTYSVRFSKIIAKKIKNKKRSLKYADIKMAYKEAKIPDTMMYFALRAYRVDRISGNVYVFNMDEFTEALIKLPRMSRKKELSAAIKYNMKRYYDYIRKQKEMKKFKK